MSRRSLGLIDSNHMNTMSKFYLPANMSCMGTNLQRRELMDVCISLPCMEHFREEGRFYIWGSLIYHLVRGLLFMLEVLEFVGVE